MDWINLDQNFRPVAGPFKQGSDRNVGLKEVGDGLCSVDQSVNC